MASLRQQLFNRINAKRDELVALTQDLVRIPTINPPGDAYGDCAVLMGKWMAARGFAVQYVRADGSPGDSDKYPRVNVIGRKEGASSGPCVHFNGHIDVVEPGLGWTVDPFEALVKDNRVYGRGTCDMKGGIAASMIAIDAILEHGVAFNGSLEISGTVDEESGGYGGVAYLAEKGHFSKPLVDQVIIPEPLNVDRVCLGHRGVWWAEIECFGRIAHGSMPFLGDSAIRHMGAVLQAFETELYPKLAQRKTAAPVVPEGARAATLNIADIHGGLPESYDGLPSPNVAHYARMMIDRRFLMEESLEDVKAEVETILERLKRERDGFNYGLRDVMTVLPMMTDPNSALVQSVSAEIEGLLDKPAQHICSPGTYDQKHICRIGKLKDCIAYGPGVLDLAHQPDEWVDIDDMVASAKIMAASALRLMGHDLEAQHV